VRRIGCRKLTQRLGFHQLHLLHATQQALAGGGRAAGTASQDQHLAQAIFERLDPLRNSGRSQRQSLCGGVEAAFSQYGGEGGQLGIQQRHG